MGASLQSVQVYPIFRYLMPRTAIVTWDFDPPKGGLGRAMQSLSAALFELGFGGNVLQSHNQWGGHVLFSLRLIVSLQRFIDEKKIDILLVPTGPGGLFLFRKPKRCKVIGISYHTYAQQYRAVPGQTWKRCFMPLERRTFNLCDSVFCYAADTKKHLCDDYNIDAPGVRLLTQLFDGIGWSEQKQRERDPNLCLCVARLEKRKGVEVLLKAWPKVTAQYPAAKLLLVGDGIQRKKIDAMIATLTNVRRLSAASLDDLRNHSATASIAICPSYLEGFGLAAVEAQAAGIPVIASRVDGLRNLIDHERKGLLTHPGDPDDLALKILQLLKDRQLRQFLSQNALNDVRERFSPERAKRELQEALFAV